jgi:hypothetical protein
MRTHPNNNRKPKEKTISDLNYLIKAVDYALKNPPHYPPTKKKHHHILKDLTGSYIL